MDFDRTTRTWVRTGRKEPILHEVIRKFRLAATPEDMEELSTHVIEEEKVIPQPERWLF